MAFDISHNGVVDTTGISMLLVSTYLNVLEYLHLQDFNDVVLSLTGLAGLLYLVIKIRGGILQNKSQKLQNKLKEKELDDKG